ncbi:hypothetical protein [Naasia sp. SYSU D00057]|uniref:hypothetical protein n=1 Tax=Naasia sp. SYSU D00057 TaxID=2817380 RepID=UPI001B305373|nr:hypothetical protein [Naasia sp. SYSU D00057]
MSDTRADDPFDPVSVEDKVEEYQMAETPEPDEERTVVEPVDDPEAPLDTGDGLLDEDDWDSSSLERPEGE